MCYERVCYEREVYYESITYVGNSYSTQTMSPCPRADIDKHTESLVNCCTTGPNIISMGVGTEGGNEGWG